MESEGLTPLVLTGWEELLHQDWALRAFLWKGQSQKDLSLARQLAHKRRGDRMPLELGPALVEVAGSGLGYTRAAKSLGLTALWTPGTDLAINLPPALTDLVRDPSQLPENAFWTMSVNTQKSKVLQNLKSLPWTSCIIAWIDSAEHVDLGPAIQFLESQGFKISCFAATGRAVQDQVWWKKQVTVASRHELAQLPSLEGRILGILVVLVRVVVGLARFQEQTFSFHLTPSQVILI